MKLIIDVPDNVYAKVMEYYELNGIVEAVYGYIYRGIPLEKIRAEIADLDDAEYEFEGYYKAVNDAVQIIDKYREEQTDAT